MGGEIWPPPPRPERDWDREGPRGRSRSRSGSPARSRRGGYSSRSRSRSLDRRRAARSSWSRSRSRSRSGSRGRRRRPFDPRDVDVDDAGRPHAAAGLGFDEEINPKADALLDAAASGGDGRIWEHDDRDRKRKRKRGRGGSPSASRRSRSRRHSRGGSDDDDDDDDDDDEPEKPSAAKTVDQETMLRMEIEASAAEKRNPEQRLDQLNLGWNSETAAVFKRAREKIRGVSGNSFDPLQLALERAQERRRTNAADAMEKLEERKNARGKLRRSRKDGDDRDDDGRRTYGKLGGMGDIDAYGKNKGVDARTERDARATRDTSAEGIAKALERKASTYAKLAAGEYDEKDADKYDVDFHAKGAMGRAGNAMAELEEEARKRDLGASIAFDYGRGGMPEWRGGAPPRPVSDTHLRAHETY